MAEQCPVCEQQASKVFKIDQKEIVLNNNPDKEGISQITDYTISANIDEVHIRNNAYTGGLDIYFHDDY
jgi:hypothetical protein